jgi:hypothetical protein
MIAYTASRQGALVYVARNEKKSRGYTIGEDDEDEDEDGNDNKRSGEEDSVWDSGHRKRGHGDAKSLEASRSDGRFQTSRWFPGLQGRFQTQGPFPDSKGGFQNPLVKHKPTNWPSSD